MEGRMQKEEWNCKKIRRRYVLNGSWPLEQWNGSLDSNLRKLVACDNEQGVIEKKLVYDRIISQFIEALGLLRRAASQTRRRAN